MITNDIDYRFMIRDVNETALHILSIYNNFEYTEIDKDKITKVYNLSSCNAGETNFNKIVSATQDVCTADNERLSDLCCKLQNIWDENKKELLTEITNVLGVCLDENKCYHACCKLHHLPINEIDDKNGCIYLNCNQDIDTLFKNFVIMLVKSFLVVKLEGLMGKGHYKYDPKNKVWLLIEIAIDAIFANSKLNKWSAKPSYSYFYNLIINRINIMEKFRKLHKLVHIDDFLNNIYVFVCENYETLIKFKNYLY